MNEVYRSMIYEVILPDLGLRSVLSCYNLPDPELLLWILDSAVVSLTEGNRIVSLDSIVCNFALKYFSYTLTPGYCEVVRSPRHF